MFQAGDYVLVTAGAFEYYEGVVDQVLADQRTVRIIVQIFGKSAPIEVDRDSLRLYPEGDTR